MNWNSIPQPLRVALIVIVALLAVILIVNIVRGTLLFVANYIWVILAVVAVICIARRFIKT